MSTIVDVLKRQAHALHQQVRSQDPQALQRVRKLRDLKSLDDPEVVVATKRRHCLKVIANEIGFAGWPHAVQIIEGTNTTDYGTFFYPKGCGAHSNIWCATYEEARNIRAKHGGFLLAYKNQFLVVDDDYIREMGLNPENPELDAFGRDWVEPGNPALRDRLYTKVVPAVQERNLPSR
jgi:hypothetical protein